MRSASIRYLIVPGWQGSPDNHWQSHWQRSLPNSVRVEQLDWLTPQRGDWVAALDQAIVAERSPVILIAHSLGCITVAHWAAQASPSALRQVHGALLVAPADVERPTCAAALRNFAPISTQPLPFPSQVVSSDNLGQRPGRECAARTRLGQRLGRGGRAAEQCRAHQRQVRARTLGAGLRLSFPAARAYRPAGPASRLNTLFTVAPRAAGRESAMSFNHPFGQPLLTFWPAVADLSRAGQEPTEHPRQGAGVRRSALAATACRC